MARMAPEGPNLKYSGSCNNQNKIRFWPILKDTTTNTSLLDNMFDWYPEYGNINKTNIYEYPCDPSHEYFLRLYVQPIIQAVYTTPYGNAQGSIDCDLSSVPEPATLSLLALGGIALLRRRRQSLRGL